MSDVQLSGRELDVLRLLADGLSNQGIARRLHLSAKTVEAAIRTLFMKLQLDDHPDTNRRVAAALWYNARQTDTERAGTDEAISGIDTRQLSRMVSTVPFDTIVAVLDERAAETPSAAWALLGAAAWCAAITDDFVLARRLAARAVVDTQPDSPQGVVVRGLAAVLDTFTGSATWNHRALDHLAALVHRSADDRCRRVVDAVAPVLEIANWFTFADRHHEAAIIIDRQLELTGVTARTPGRVAPAAELDLARCCRAELDLRRGRWDSAATALAIVLRDAGESGNGVGYACVLAARLEAGRGRVNAAESLVERARSFALERGDRSTAWRADAVEGFTRQSTHDSATAVAVLAPLVDQARRSGLRLPSVRTWEADLVEALVSVGDIAGARATTAWLADDVRATASRWGEGALHRAEGLVAPSPVVAAAHLDRSASTFRAIDAPFEAARSDHLAGIAYLGDDRLADAASRFRRALATFRSLRAGTFAEVTADHLEALDPQFEA
jgi:DNA-binding CsgD family transcriptional regulator